MKRSTFWGVGLLAFVYILLSPKAQAASVAYETEVQPPGGAPVRLHVEERGNGPPLVLLHGMGGSSYTFRHLVDPLARHHRVIALDLKGFGRSEKPLDHAYGPHDQAQLITAFLRQRRLAGVTLTGHSFGGAVALLTTLMINRSEPWRIKRLVLMNAPAFTQELPAHQRLLTMPVLPYVALGVVPPLLTMRAALETRFRATAPATDADAIRYAEPLYETGGRHALITTARVMAELDTTMLVPRYRTIHQPALLIWCRHDRTVPLANGERLRDALANARLAVLDQCEHTPPEEQPQATLALLGAAARRP